MNLFAIIYFSCFQTIVPFNLWNSKNNENFDVDPNDYGVDYTYPIHHHLNSKRTPYFSSRYNDLMKGCYKKYSKNECDVTEEVRLDMNLAQPASEHNYTEVGFKKLKVPKEAWEPLLSFYNSNRDKERLESWPRGNTYVNHWDSPSYMISLEDSSFRGGQVLKKIIWDTVKPIIEEWTGKKVEPTSLYGIRVYHDKAILATRKHK
jgi:prolyl 4-hydroxylase